MKVRSWLLALPLAAAATCGLAEPQLILVNAKVFTADPARPRAEAVAIQDGRILAVGRTAEVRALAGSRTRVIDAGGRLVTPGLVEAHVHIGWDLPSPPLALPGLPFPGPTSQQVLSEVELAAHKRAPGWISAWVGPRVARDPRNWRNALDAVAPETPVLLRGFWGHTSIVNSAALRALGIGEDVANPVAGWWGRDGNGRLDGRVYEMAEDIEQRAAPPVPSRVAKEFAAAGQRYAEWGVTSIHLMNSGVSLPVALEALKIARPLQKWTVYSWAGSLPSVGAAWEQMEAAAPAAPDKVTVEGPKWMLDGTPIEQNAWRRTPYPGRDGWRGRSNVTDTQLRDILERALRSPRQLALHVVGDAQTDHLIEVMREMAPAEVWRSKRVRIEHGDGIRADILAKVADLGLVVIQNPTHFPPPSPVRDTEHALLAGLVQAGISVAIGSDGSPDEWNPFLNIMLATTYHAAPAQALTREQALLAYTAAGAFAARVESRTGRLAPGHAADLAVLSQDILEVPAERLPATRSLLTVVDGIVVHDAGGW
jgi:predicted amidohydrolase YtcJ